MSMYDVNLTEDQVQLLRWSIQVASNTISAQQDGPITPQDRVAIAINLEGLDESLVSQIKPQREAIFGAPDKIIYKQLAFDFDNL